MEAVGCLDAGQLVWWKPVEVNLPTPVDHVTVRVPCRVYNARLAFSYPPVPPTRLAASNQTKTKRDAISSLFTVPVNAHCNVDNSFSSCL